MDSGRFDLLLDAGASDGQLTRSTKGRLFITVADNVYFFRLNLALPPFDVTCTKHKGGRTVLATTFDLFRAVVQKDDGTNFEAQMYIRWCDKSTPGCV